MAEEWRHGGDWHNLVKSGRVYDLGQPLDPGMPVSSSHPGFRMVLVRRHGDVMRDEGLSAATDLIVMGGHNGTHFDALAHISHNGKLFGGVDAQEAQLGGRFKELGLDSVAPIFCPGVLLDVAGHRGVDVLPPGEAITAEELRTVAAAEGVDLPMGGAVLVRSGWSRYWGDPVSYLGEESGVPGPDVSAARWIAAASPRVTGHDSMAYEWIAPGAGHSRLPVHRIMLVEHGIHLIENLNLEQMAADRVYQFLFVCLPLNIVGGTGSPVRPVAVAF